MRKLMLLGSVLALVGNGLAATPAETYGAELARPLLPKSTTSAACDAIYAQVKAADLAADAAWRKLGSRSAYEAHRQRLRTEFIRAIGGLDLPRTPLNAQITGTFAHSGYRVERVLMESRPGVYVTGLLYLPDPARFPAPYPGCIVTCGHTPDGKAAAMYQRYGVMGAQAGFAVFAYDPIAQGERDQPPAGAGNVLAHERYGVLAAMLGQSAARTRIWDGLRAVDYLLSREEVKKDGVGCMGQSGGGTMTSYLATVDPRIVAACPSCFVSTMREVCLNCGPQDAEQNNFGQLAFGLNHAGFVLAGGGAVRMHCNEADFFPFGGSQETYAVVAEVAKACGLGEGRYGFSYFEGPHNCTEGTRISSIQWMRRWVQGDAATPPVDVAACRAVDKTFNLKQADCGLSVPACLVTPQGKVSKLPGSKSIFDILKDDLAAAEKARPARDAAARREVVRQRAGIRPRGEVKYTVREVGTAKLADGVTVRREVYTFADGIPVPVVSFVPAGEVKGCDLVIGDRTRARHGERTRVALAAGRAIAYVDVACTGETNATYPKIFRREADNYGGTMLLLLGRSLVGVRAEEILVVAAALRARVQVAPRLVAHGRTAIAAAHAFAVEPELFAGIEVRNPPAAWRASVMAGESTTFANVVWGALRDYDWPELLPPAPAGGSLSLGGRNRPDNTLIR